jgi:hypothetical protein
MEDTFTATIIDKRNTETVKELHGSKIPLSIGVGTMKSDGIRGRIYWCRNHEE